MEEGHMLWWVQIYPFLEWWLHQCNNSSGWSATHIMPTDDRISLRWHSCDLGMLPLIRFGFSNVMCPKIWGLVTTWIYWVTRFFHQFVFFLMAQAFFWSQQDLFGLKLWKSGLGSMTRITRICRQRVNTLTLLRNFRFAGENLTQLSSFHHQYKIFGEKECNFWQNLTWHMLIKMISRRCPGSVFIPWCQTGIPRYTFIALCFKYTPARSCINSTSLNFNR